MEPVLIDREECSGCGLCAAICPYRAIRIEGEAAVYCLDDCFLCGHCRAVCPEEAVTIPGLDSGLNLTTVAQAPEGTLVEIGSLVALMQSRRSCRSYLEKDLPPPVLDDLVGIGTTAPSGTNSQGWGFIVLETRPDVLALGRLVADYYRRLNRLASRATLRKVLKLLGRDSLDRYYHRYHSSVAEALREWDEAGVDRLFHGATGAILVTGSKTAGCPAEDALLASQNILLAAEAMGLGSCLIGFVVEAAKRDRRLRLSLGMFPGEELYAVIALGYPAVHWQHCAGRKPFRRRTLKLAQSAGDGRRS